MITVAILINGKPIMARSAVNHTTINLAGHCEYHVDDGTKIVFNPHRGAVALGIELLKTIKEPKARKRAVQMRC